MWSAMSVFFFLNGRPRTLYCERKLFCHVGSIVCILSLPKLGKFHRKSTASFRRYVSATFPHQTNEQSWLKPFSVQ